MKKIVMMTAGVALVAAAAGLAQSSNSADVLLGEGLHQDEVEGNCRQAIKTFERIVNQKNAPAKVAARAQLQIGICQEKLGQREARVTYELLVTRYPDQADMVAEARSRIAALGSSAAGGGFRVRRLFGDVGRPGGLSRNGSVTSYTDGSGLHVYDVLNGASRRILATTDGRSDFTASEVSPDGNQVAYTLHNAETTDEIHLVNADGTQDRLLFKNSGPGIAWPGAWSPDGQEMLGVVNKDGKWNLLQVNVATGAQRTIVSLQGGLNSNPCYSPDGRYVFFEDTSDIFSIPVAGGEPVPVVDHQADDRLVGFAPDGRMVFASDRSGHGDLWAITIRDGKAAGATEFILSGFDKNRPVGLARDGSLLYVTNPREAEVYTVELNASARMSSGPMPISSRFEGVNSVPDYSADGQLLAYVSGLPNSLQSDIRIRTVATGEELSVPNPAQTINQLRWYRDGRSLLVFGESGSSAGFYRLDLQSGDSTKILDAVPGFIAANPTFSPDGNHLYYEIRDGDVAALMRMDMTTGAKQEVLRPPTGVLRIYSLSPDGTQIVYNWREDGQDFLYLVPVTGGEPKLLSEASNQCCRGFGGLAWSADGRSVLSHRISDLGSSDELVWIPVDGGDPVSLVTTGVVRRIAVHPDGRQIAFEARSSSKEVFVMENLFSR